MEGNHDDSILAASALINLAMSSLRPLRTGEKREGEVENGRMDV